jgi:hypothetical protein
MEKIFLNYGNEPLRTLTASVYVGDSLQSNFDDASAAVIAGAVSAMPKLERLE